MDHVAAFLELTMTTYTGRRVRPFALTRADVDGADIAWSLARICRFNGHVRVEDGIYSVAEHSVRASRVFPSAAREVQLAILLHDAHEAYFGDYIRPVKRHPMFDQLTPYLERAQAAINAVYGLAPDAQEHELVGRADEIMAWTELRDVMAPHPREAHVAITDPREQPLRETIIPWSIRASRANFEARLRELLEV